MTRSVDDWFRSTMTAAYGADFYAQDSDAYHRATLAIEIAVAKGMGQREFRDRVYAFIAECPWPTWKVSDLLGLASRAMLHPYSWYCERVAENRANAGAIGAYRVEGHAKPLFGWRHEVGDRLPEWSAQAEVRP